MSLENAVEKFCSRELITREQSDNKIVVDNIEYLRCSHGSQGKTESESEACDWDYDINSFFKQAELLGIELLADDKRWLQSFNPGNINEELGAQYIHQWLDAMNKEKMSFRKQNKGRYAANVFIRGALKKLQLRTNLG